MNIIPKRLQGDGFFLRRWEIEDAAWYVLSRDEEIFQWTTEKRDLTIAEAEAAILKINSNREALCFAIVDMVTGNLLGNIALAFDTDRANTAEMMYWLAAAARGRGIATQAVLLLTNLAFLSLGLDHIVLKTLPGNLRSQLVAERAGFRQVEAEEADYIWFERNKSSRPSFPLPGHLIRVLTAADLPILQSLLERCADFHLLVTGLPPQPGDAAALLEDRPPNTSLDDKTVLGIFTPAGALLGVLDYARHYPQPIVWWLGLLLLDPASRGKGLGAAVYRAFEIWAQAQGAKEICLGVVESNQKALLFWESQGFTIIDKRPPVQMGLLEQAIYVMKKVPVPSTGNSGTNNPAR